MKLILSVFLTTLCLLSVAAQAADCTADPEASKKRMSDFSLCVQQGAYSNPAYASMTDDQKMAALDNQPQCNAKFDAIMANIMILKQCKDGKPMDPVLAKDIGNKLKKSIYGVIVKSSASVQ